MTYQQRKFYLGSSYYPPFHTPEEWATDVVRMAEAGLNAMRTAELIASWEWLEPQKGRFDWGWLDRAFELCTEHGLQLLLGTGAGSPPIWLLDLYPDVQILSQDGIPYPTGAMWGWACIHHPGYLAESERYLRTLLGRYGGRPQLIGWQLHNEPGYPAIARGAGLPEIYCYCQHCAAGFRRWLQDKYGDIEALSEAWACTPTRHRYHDWAQVRPPRAAPIGWGSPGAWLDWRLYIEQSWADFIAWQNQIVKSVDQQRPTTVNLVHLLGRDLGAVRGIDPWRFPETCDALGIDLYPVDRFKAEPFYCSIELDYARAPALHAGKPLWLPEIESGPIGEWVLGPAHATSARDIRRYDLEAIGHGAKMLLYQGYREWEPLPLHWGALVDLEGQPTERYEEAARVNQVVLAHEQLFLAAQPERAQIGVLVDPRNVIANLGMGAAEMLAQAIKGVYNSFWTHHYPLEFITPELLAAGKGGRYRLLVLPFMTLITPACAEALKQFVAGGGVVVAFAKCGMLDERSWYWRQRPGGLGELFGVSETRIAKAEQVELHPEPGVSLFAGTSGALAGAWHRQDFSLAAGVKVVARYGDGAPAVTQHHFGAGRALLFGTHFDVASLAPEAGAHRRVFANLAAGAGVERPFTLSGGPLLDGHLLRSESQHLFILINHGPEPAMANVVIPSLSPEVTVTDLFSETQWPAAPHAGGLAFTRRLSAYDSTVLLLA